MQTAKTILAIPETEPERLFSRERIKPLLVELASIWHPDHCKDKDANAVMAHINLLYQAALKKDKDDTWEEPDTLYVTLAGSEKRFHYIKRHDFDIGRVHIGHKYVVYTFAKGWEDAADNFVKAVKAVKIPKGKQKMALRLPQNMTLMKSKGLPAIRIDKTPDLLNLSDVNDHYKGKIPTEHIAWITSELMNMSCLLEHCEVAHSGIEMLDCFISPEFHSVALLGGWWYSKAFGQKMNLITGRTVDAVPERIIKPGKDYIGAAKTDRYLIRRLACELRGDPTGVSFIRDKSTPQPIEQWLNMPVTNTAVQDFSAWYAALEKSFGKRRFSELKLNADDIYKEK